MQVVKRGLMQELLTRGLPGKHSQFKHTEVGETPEGWRTNRIGEIASCDYGTSESLQSCGAEMPVLRMGNLHLRARASAKAAKSTQVISCQRRAGTNRFRWPTLVVATMTLVPPS